ncbi:MAG: hypothetical protein FD149_1928 [Rhodospirillaceae bacterium]|nr:MAG: hypothetical protein FD149_1928 [Rhodospirillaceae bacterium]
MRRVLIGVLFAVILGSVLGSGNVSARSVQPRTYANPAGYGRLAFDWDGPVVYSARIEGGMLVVTFDRPVEGAVRNTLPGYVTTVTLSADRRTVTFALAPGKTFSVKAGFYKNVVAVDLSEEKDEGKDKNKDKDKEQSQNKSLPSGTAEEKNAPTALLPLTSPSTSPPPAAATPLTSGAAMVAVRVGSHDTADRIVFDWPMPVPYEVSESPEATKVVFAKKGHIDMTPLLPRMWWCPIPCTCPPRSCACRVGWPWMCNGSRQRRHGPRACLLSPRPRSPGRQRLPRHQRKRRRQSKRCRRRGRRHPPVPRRRQNPDPLFL